MGTASAPPRPSPPSGRTEPCRAHWLRVAREPVAHRLRDVGEYFLSGAHPPFVLPA